MNRIRRDRRKDQSGRAAPSKRPPGSVAAKTVIQREAGILAGEQAADRRRATADRRHETANQREATADLREATADLRHVTADQREETADLREEIADLREQTADLREESTKAKAALSALAGERMREVNERLVIATIHAQTLTENAEQASAQMAHMAEHDFLTGLPNRSLLIDRLTQAIALGQRHAKRVALMYLDLDNFKHINDTLGHEVGDQLLQSVAKRLQTCVRLSDTVSRQGGDEFVVLLAEVEAARDAALSAEKLIKAMAEPHLIGGHHLHITVSIGISLYPDDGGDVDTVIRNADTAMYHAKRSGRNNYQLFNPDMIVQAVERVSVEKALHRALEQHEFVLHYQPKVNLETGAITGAEALLRLRSNHRLVGPEQFVGIAEESGLILPIGRWVLREACRQTRAWLQAGLELGQIAVNISKEEFHSKGFLNDVRDILEHTGLGPHRLELELTESGLMHDAEMAAVNLHALKGLGVHIAVDHFGTGYSCLSYLRRFPIDTLKIDQSFVQEIDGNADDFAMLSTIIAMGENLKRRVVADGIETRHQLSVLQSHRCTEGQGYYFGRPVAAEEFAGLLAAGRH